MKTIICWVLPIETVSEGKNSEHWRRKSERHKLQKLKVKTAFLKERPKIQLPTHVVITRIAPRELDVHDNLPYSLKWIADAIAENLTGDFIPGHADRIKDITWEYRQKKGQVKEYSVMIEFITEKI
jgi:hypothetical protein